MALSTGSIPTGQEVIFTAGTRVPTVLQKIRVVNNSGVDRTFTLYLNPGTATPITPVNLILPVGDMYENNDEWELPVGKTLEAKASGAGLVFILQWKELR